MLVGRKIGVTKNTSVLVGGGTCICGGTAIATLSRIIKATDAEIAFGMAAIFLFDTISAFSYPYIAPAIGFTENQFAFVAGTAINDTSSVAGAQATYQAMIANPEFSGALNVKLVRTTMLIFVAIVWTVLMARDAKKNGEAGSNDSILAVVQKTFPMFILYFVLASVVTTLAMLLGVAARFCSVQGASQFCIIMAMAAIGLNTDIVKLIKGGRQPLLLGLACWVAITLVSLAMQHLLGIW